MSADPLLETIADAIADADSMTGQIEPTATAILAAIAATGRLLPDGGETREVWDVETAGVRWPGYETEAAAWEQVAKVKAWADRPTVRVLRRTITDWPDRRRHVAPGTEVAP